MAVFFLDLSHHVVALLEVDFGFVFRCASLHLLDRRRLGRLFYLLYRLGPFRGAGGGLGGSRSRWRSDGSVRHEVYQIRVWADRQNLYKLYIRLYGIIYNLLYTLVSVAFASFLKSLRLDL